VGDSFSSRQLGGMLSKIFNKSITVFDGDTEELRAALVANGAPAEYASVMSHYFESVEEGRGKMTDTVVRVLGRKPGSYAHWLERNRPGILSSIS